MPEEKSKASGFRFGPLLGIAVILVLGFGTAAFMFWRGSEVSVVTAIRGDAAEVVYATGVVEPVHWAKITALQRKRIVDLCRCEGEPVKKGDVLARLDDTEEQAVLTEIEARLERLRADAERLGKLVASNVSSRIRLRRSADSGPGIRSAACSARGSDRRSGAQVADGRHCASPRRRSRRDRRHDAPTRRFYGSGKARPLRIVAEINEEDINKVRPRQRVLLRHEGHEGDPLEAVVERLTPKGDPETKTFRAYLRLSKMTPPLMIGMSIEANIVVREAKQVVLVPAEAVVDGHVQIAEQDSMTLTPIEVGIRGSGMVELKNGVEAGDHVVSPFRPELKHGERIRFEPPGEG